MSAIDWITVIGFGAVLGLLGQGLRVVAGMKKRSERARAQAAEPFDRGKLYMSLFTGALAGALAAIGLREHLAGAVSEELVLALLASGYAGSDFIDGFMQKHLNHLAPDASATAAAAPAATAAPEANEADADDDRAPVDRPGGALLAQG